MKNTICAKEFGRYRVRLVLAPGGQRILITDKKECDRTIAKIEASSGIDCFNSVTQETIDDLVAYMEMQNSIKDMKQSFSQSVKGYIYGTIDLVTETEWFKPSKAVRVC